jgi:hypothetical protein
MTLDDLKRIFLSPTLFRLDTILAPRLVPLLDAAGLAALLLWGVSHLFWTFGRSFGDGLWGLLEIVVFGFLWLLLLRIGTEALAVFFKSHEAAAESLSHSRLPAPLLDDVADAIHDLADEVEPPVGEYESGDAIPPSGSVPDYPPPPDVPVRGPTVRRTAKRTPPIPTPPPTPDVE